MTTEIEKFDNHSVIEITIRVFIVVGFLIIFIGFPLVHIVEVNENTPPTIILFITFINDFYANSAAELFSIVITVTVIDRLYRSRDQSERKKEERDNLLIEILGKDKADSLKALQKAKQKGYLEGNESLLTKKTIDTRLWDNAELSDCNLRHIIMTYSDLNSANLERSLLSNSTLIEIDFSGAVMRNTDFDNVKIDNCNLTGVDLKEAVFTNVTAINGSNFTGVDFTCIKGIITNLKADNKCIFRHAIFSGINLGVFAYSLEKPHRNRSGLIFLQ